MTEGTSDKSPEIPDEWMDRILGAVRVTVNAAIMDYHRIQVSSMEEQITALEQHLDSMKQRIGEDRILGIDEITELVRAVVSEMLRDHQGEPRTQARELVSPPKQTTQFGTRKVAAERASLQAECDKALWDLFEKERIARGYDVNEMLDFVLYNYYDRPALSFQFATRGETP